MLKITNDLHLVVCLQSNKISFYYNRFVASTVHFFKHLTGIITLTIKPFLLVYKSQIMFGFNTNTFLKKKEI